MIGVCALVWAVGWNAVDPRGLALGRPLPRRAGSDARYLTHAEAGERFRDGRAVFVDVRPLAAWRQGRIPSAVHLPADDFGAAYARMGSRLPLSEELVLYCDGPHCELADRTWPKLQSLGYVRCLVYEGGWEEWVGHHGPEERDLRGPK